MKSRAWSERLQLQPDSMKENSRQDQLQDEFETQLSGPNPMGITEDSIFSSFTLPFEPMDELEMKPVLRVIRRVRHNEKRMDFHRNPDF
jgi:hypothetical protein